MNVPSSSSHSARHRVELDLAGIDPHVHAVQAPQLTQLGAREGRLRGAAPAEHDHLPDAALAQRLERVVGHVGALELGDAQREHADHVRGHVAVADHDGPLGREVELARAVVRVAVVPGHEVRGGPAARHVLPGYPQRLVGLGPGGVDHGRVVIHQLEVRDVAADLHVAEEAAAALERLSVERVLQALYLLVVGRHPAAQQPPRRGQPLEQVDLGIAVRPQQAGGGECSGRPGADDRDPRSRAVHQVAVRSIVLRPAKNCALSSSA